MVETRLLFGGRILQVDIRDTTLSVYKKEGIFGFCLLIISVSDSI